MDVFQNTGKTLLIFLLLLLPCGISAQQIEFSSALNPVGSGARATGMGGAFIGVADDATAASWNPAGLVQLEKPEVSAVYSYFHRKQEYSSDVNPEIETENTMDTDGLNYASIVYPFSLFNRNMTVSLNYQRLFEMDKDTSFRLNRVAEDFFLADDIDFKQDGYLYTLSPAYAVQIFPQLYLGATFNFWDNIFGKNGWDATYDSVAEGIINGNPVVIKLTQKEDVSFEGFNAHLGFLWRINDSWTLGGVYKTEFDADLTKKTTLIESQEWPSFGIPPDPKESYTEQDLTMTMPASYGLGLSYRHSDTLTMALDVSITDWSSFVIENEKNEEINPLDGRPLSEGRLEDTTQVRLGMEYLFIREKDVIPVRCGLFYDPEPAKGSPDDFYGFTVGSGYARGRFVFDIAYQYRTGNDVTGDIPTVEGSSADIDQHTVWVSLIVYLDDLFRSANGAQEAVFH